MDVTPVLMWFMRVGPAYDVLTTLMEDLLTRLDEVGLRIDRVWQAHVTLHPEVAGRSWDYVRGTDAETVDLGHGQLAGTVPGSPLARVFDGESEVRVRLAEADDARSAELLARGYTDYFIGQGPDLFPRDRVRMAQLGRPARSSSVTSWSTRQPGGWTDAQVEALRQVHRMFTLAAEVAHQRLIARGLLEAYLGKDAGLRVLSGQVRRGDVRRIDAAILFTDLRGFTRLSEELQPDALVAMLSDAFDAQIGAIEAEGGSVLQIVGDGLCAIFEGEPAVACPAALRAVRGIEAAVDAVNARRSPPIAWGAGLHYGEAHHGNFGAANRLVFTVNGPAVNRAARLESIGARLGLRPALSAEFAAHCGEAVVEHGVHEAKGVGSIALWALA